jgi:uncharacterized membrane protein HdeD (DUF308 family)
MAKKKSYTNLFTAILYIVIGVILAAFPGNALQWAIYIAGALFLIFGILELIKKNWFGGAISLIIGIAILALGYFLLDIVVLVLGILIAVKGIITLVQALMKKSKNVLTIVFAILTIVGGIILAFGNGLHLVLIIAGIFLAINGVIGLISALKK